jgi:hypothetical protein
MEPQSFEVRDCTTSMMSNFPFPAPVAPSTHTVPGSADYCITSQRIAEALFSPQFSRLPRTPPTIIFSWRIPRLAIVRFFREGT